MIETVRIPPEHLRPPETWMKPEKKKHSELQTLTLKRYHFILKFKEHVYTSWNVLRVRSFSSRERNVHIKMSKALSYVGPKSSGKSFWKCILDK